MTSDVPGAASHAADRSSANADGFRKPGPDWCVGTGWRIGENPHIAAPPIPNVGAMAGDGLCDGGAGRSQLPGQLGGGCPSSGSPPVTTKARPGPRFIPGPAGRGLLAAYLVVGHNHTRLANVIREQPARSGWWRWRVQSERSGKTACRDTSRGPSQRRRLLPEH